MKPNHEILLLSFAFTANPKSEFLNPKLPEPLNPLIPV